MTEAITTFEKPKGKEKLSDEEMGNLLSAVGNHEAKAITISLMGDENLYGRRDIYVKVLNAQGGNIGWAMNPEVPFAYCSKSFFQFGLVEKEIDPNSSVVKYRIAEDGEEEGVPLAGLLLNFSEKYNISLDRLFGGTRSSSPGKKTHAEKGKEIEFKKRSPSTTLKILYALVISTSFPIRETDLAERIGEEEPTQINGHLIRLSELGLIEHQGKKANVPFSRYKLSFPIPEGELPFPQNRRGLTRSVFDVLRAYPDKKLTAGEISELLPIEQKEGLRKENLKNHISLILAFLNREKYVELEKFNSYKQSEISITDTQRVVLAELLEILYRFQNRDREILSQGKRLAGEIITNPQRVSNLLQRAKEASRQAGQSPPEETQEKILSYVLSNPDGVTIKNIQEFLKTQGKELGRTQVCALSSSLTKNGSIRVRKEGKVYRFFPNKPESISPYSQDG